MPSCSKVSAACEGGARAKRRIIVSKLVSGRYEAGYKPIFWDQRGAKVETVETVSGERISIFSGGGQATPGPGWELLLSGKTKQDSEGDSGECWTLYGIRASTRPAQN